MAADWLKIRNEYISTKTSYRKLAEKYGISIDAIKRRAVAEKWTKERAKIAPQIHQKTIQKIIEKTAAQEADRIVRLLAVSDKLMLQLEKAVGELDKQTLRQTTRKRHTETEKVGGKIITKEVISAEEAVRVVKSAIDRQGVRALAGVAKDLMDIANIDKTDETALLKLDDLIKGIDNAAAKP